MFNHPLTNAFGDQYFYEINGSTFATHSAEQIFRERYGDELLAENSLIIFIGTDGGLLVKYIHQHQAQDSCYLFIELPSVIQALTQQQLLPSPIDNVIICPPDEWQQVAETFNIKLYSYTESIKLYSSIGTADAYLPDYISLAPQIHKAVIASVTQLTRVLFNRIFIQPILQNAAHNLQPAAKLRHCFKGKTAVILGGGPSLDELLPWVIKNRAKIVILAVSRICRQLHAIGFRPDIIFSVDPTEVSYEVSKYMLHFNDVLFIHANHVNPRLLAQYQGKTAYLGTRFPWQTPQDINHHNIDITPPTVTNSAINNAVEFGFTQIILIGVDLCFSPTGFSHAKGSNEHETGPVWGHNHQTVTTNDGRTAETSTYFYLAIEPMAKTAEQAHQQGIKVISPVGYAVKLPYVDYIIADHILLTPLDEPVDATIDRVLPALPQAEQISTRQATLTAFIQIKLKLQKIKQLAQSALASLTMITHSDNPANHLKQNKKLDKIDKTLNRDFPSIITLIKKQGIRDFMKIVDPAYAKNITFDLSLEKSRLLYQAYFDNADALISLLNTMIHLIESRLLEDTPVPDYQRLIKQWQSDHQPGRALIWQQQHPELTQQLPPTIQTEFAQLQSAFIAELDRPCDHTQYISEKTGLPGVRNKARQCFKNNNLPGLKNLLTGLQFYQEANQDPNGPQYRILILAYIADLSNESKNALTLYDQITRDELIEDAYPQAIQRLIASEQYNKAIEYFERIHQLTPVYQTQYADLLRLTGHVQQALDLYTESLQRTPNDLDTMMKLGKLYHSLNVPEAAKWAFEQVAELQPNNQEAHDFLDQLNH